MGAARKPLIALAAGGTGGHVFPALAVAEALRGAGIDTLLMTDRRGARLVPPAGRTVLAAASPFQRGLPRRALALLKLGFGLSQALVLMLRRRPAAMVGFGGYPSFAPLLAARLTGVPALLHEQNAFLGRANNLLARWTGHLALSWPDTANLPPAVTNFVSGMPVRSAFFAIAPRPDSNGGPLSLTVIGGSLGAAVLADLVPAAVAALPDSIRSRMSVTQQCRAEQLDALCETYAAIGVTAEIATFFDDMPARFAAADLVVARAGASTVADPPELNGTDVGLLAPPQAAAVRATTATASRKGGRISIIGSPFAGITRSRFWSGRQRLRRSRRSLPSQPGVRPELPGGLSVSRLPVGPCRR